MGLEKPSLSSEAGFDRRSCPTAPFEFEGSIRQVVGTADPVGSNDYRMEVFAR